MKLFNIATITAGAALCFTIGLTLPHPSKAEYDTPRNTPTAAAQDAYCPDGSSLTIFEDGSGACYAPGGYPHPVTDYDGLPFSWPEGTFAWDPAHKG